MHPALGEVFALSKYIIKFHKADSVKFVSHLDLIRVFDRAMRRAQLPMGYSAGFNPHPLMTFAHPLGVGISSVAELLEMQTAEPVDTEFFKETLGKHMPSGFEIEDIKEIPGKNNFASLSLADYEIEIEGEFPQKSLETLFNEMQTMVVDKKTKSGVKETDIKPFVADFKEIEKGKYTARLKTGAENLKPELFVSGLSKYIDGFEPSRVVILRTCLLNEKGQPLF